MEVHLLSGCCYHRLSGHFGHDRSAQGSYRQTRTSQDGLPWRSPVDCGPHPPAVRAVQWWRLWMGHPFHRRSSYFGRWDLGWIYPLGEVHQ